MKVKNQKRLVNGLKGLAAAVVLTAGVFVVSSFDDSGSSGDSSDGIWETDPPVDCSTSEIVYNYVATSGSGAGSISGSGNPSGGSGSISGSGASSTIQSGAKGTLFTPKSSQDCSFSLFSTCYKTPCHATGPATYKPFK